MGNPIKGSDLYQDDGAIEKGIKDLEKMREAYTSVLDTITKEAENLIAKLKEVNTTTTDGQGAAKKAMTDAEKLKKAQKDYASALNETNTKIRALREAKREDIREQKLQNKLARSAEGSYNKLSAQYALNKLALNKMSIAERNATKSGQLLETQTREIYEEMNRLQKATGKHTLQVGNYGIATENLHPILGRVNMGLSSMGTSLDALGKADKPFKVLSNAVVNFGKATMTFMLSPIGLAITAIGALFYLIMANKDTVLEFNNALIDVGKTANLSGDDLRGLGQDVVDLSRKLKVIGTPALLEYAKVAGQLGVKGRENILAFTESLAKLETATDISGDEGASNIARLLTLTDGGVENVAEFGDEIVNLGNNFAATENEILTNATAIAQNAAQYGIGRKTVLAYATATKAVGLEAELTGSTIGRTLGLMEKAIRTGKGINEIANVTGQSIEDLKKQFSEDPASVFTNFISGLNEVNEAGGSVNEQLENIGITSIRDQRVISSLATAGFDVLKGSIDEVNNSAGSLDKEFGAAASKLDAQLSRVGIAWDNLVLTIEDGEGVFSRVAAFFAGVFADYLDNLSFGFKVLGAVVQGVIAVFKNYLGYVKRVVNTLREVGDIEISLNPLENFKSFKNAFKKVKDVVIENGKDAANTFGSAFANELARSMKAADDAMNKTADDIDARLEQSIKKSVKSVGDLDAEISALNKTLKGASTRGEARDIQNQIKALEKQRNAILGVANANLKELESRAMNKRKAEVEVMEEGESKDVAILEIEMEEKKKIWAKYNLDIKLLEDYEARQRFLIAKKYLDKAKDEADKLKAEQERAAQQRFSNAKEVIEQETDLRMSEIDILKATEAEKTRLRLEAERDRLQKILALNEKLGGKLSQLQIDTIKNTIEKIGQEIQTAGEGQRDIFSMVGLNLDDEQKAAISESMSFALENLRSFLDAKVEASEIAVQKAQEETSAAESRYQAEIDARNNGYANNVATAQKELEQKRKNEAKALKDKEKAQKAQEAIDTAMQISGLITSSVQIWKSLAGIPVVGPALAAAAVGVMWGSFAASKIKAKSVAKEKYGDGGFEFLDGGSHASGNDIPIGTTSGGKQRTAEGGETLAIIKKSSTRKYRGVIPTLIDSLNKGTFENVFSNSFIPSEEMPSLVNVGYDSPDLKKIEDDLGEIKRRGSTQRYTDGDGRLVEIYKNVKRVYVR